MQVAELDLSFAGGDTLVMLSQEYPMLAANAAFEPVNGIIFSDPFMNMVLRSFTFNDDGVIMDVDEDQYFLDIAEHEAVPGDFLMVQCFPNPCRDYAKLRFGLREGGEVKIGLYDMRGVKLEDLTEQYLDAGFYELEINAALLEAGTYFFRLQTNESFCTIKLVVGL
jgi:hypothetical protein